MTQDFRIAMLEHSLNPPDHIIAGKLHRFPGADKSNDSTAGWCRLFDDQQAGVFGDWSTGLSELWIAKRETPYTSEEKAKFMRHVAEARQKAEIEKDTDHKISASKADFIWKNCNKLTDDDNDIDYLLRKNIKSHGIRLGQAGLTIPVYIDDKISSLQFINPKGEKKFLPGGKAQGGYYIIGDINGDKPICVAEGFATAATIYQATGYPVLVAFSAGNIKPVAEYWRSQLPDQIFIICADDDALTKGNPGVTAAHDAAIAIKGKIAIPTFGEIRPDGATDFNDMAACLGSDAVAKCINSVLDEPKCKAEKKPTVIPGITKGFLTHADVADLFKDCIYITKERSILTKIQREVEGEPIDVVDLLTRDEFDATFGGRRFPMDAEYKKWTQYASECLLHSTVYTKREAHRTWLNPKEKFGQISFDGSHFIVNKFVPANVVRRKGDVTPFIHHLEKLFPDENDRKIITCYMAALVQCPGIKFKWCPLIQGVEGNGKGTIVEFLSYAIGTKYCSSINAQQLEKEYNSFLTEKILLIIHDVFVPEDRAVIYEKLKPMITEKYHSIRKMHTDPYDAEVFCNWFMMSQHIDAIKKTANDRRYTIFITPQQNIEDLEAWGLTPKYHKDLHDWMLEKGGLQFVAEYLFTYDLSDAPELYNPALGGIAPVTSSRDMAIQHSYSIVEQEILEVIDEGQTYGARGNFISSVAIENILVRLRRNNSIKSKKRVQILNTIGYVLHPALSEGRVTRLLAHENKPRIYVRKNSPEFYIESGSEATDAYFKAQQL